MNNQRPRIVDGIMRDYFKDGFYIVEVMKNNEWIEITKVPEEKVEK